MNPDEVPPRLREAASLIQRLAEQADLLPAPEVVGPAFPGDVTQEVLQGLVPQLRRHARATHGIAALLATGSLTPTALGEYLNDARQLFEALTLHLAAIAAASSAEHPTTFPTLALGEA